MLASLRFRLRRSDDLQVWLALQALRFGEPMLFAPVSRRLERGDERGVAAGAERLGNLVLTAPILVRAWRYRSVGVRSFLGGSRRGVRCGVRPFLALLLATGERERGEDAECEAENGCLAHDDFVGWTTHSTAQAIETFVVVWEVRNRTRSKKWG